MSAPVRELGRRDLCSIPRVHHYDRNTGLHESLGPDCALKTVQYWVKQDGTTAKAASLAVPPMQRSNSVQGLTQHFEQMTMRHTANPMEMGYLPDEATAEIAQITLNHNEVNMEEERSTHIQPCPSGSGGQKL